MDGGGKALVTGGSGLVGRAVCDALAAKGFSVHVWDLRTAAGSADRSPQIRYEAVDVGRPPSISESYDVVFHLAAETENRATGLGSVVTSLTGLAGVLDMLRRQPPGLIVFASSQLVYGSGEGNAESAIPAPLGSFAAGKLAGEVLLAAFGRETGVPTLSCRLCNIIGPNVQRGIVRDLVDRVRSTVGGELAILGDGSQKRSYLLAEDCAAAMVLCAEGRPWSTVNVGNVDSMTALEVADTVVLSTGRNLRVRPSTGPTGWATDPGTLTMDVSRLLSLGWAPRTSSAEAVANVAAGLWCGGQDQSASPGKIAKQLSR